MSRWNGLGVLLAGCLLVPQVYAQDQAGNEASAIAEENQDADRREGTSALGQARATSSATPTNTSDSTASGFWVPAGDRKSVV